MWRPVVYWMSTSLSEWRTASLFWTLPSRVCISCTNVHGFTAQNTAISMVIAMAAFNFKNRFLDLYAYIRCINRVHLLCDLFKIAEYTLGRSEFSIIIHWSLPNVCLSFRKTVFEKSDVGFGLVIDEGIKLLLYFRFLTFSF